MTVRVVFLAPYVKHYRVPFFDLLHKTLAEDDIELRVLYGEPNSAHAARKDNVVLPSSYGYPVSSYWIIDRLVYQAAWRQIANADLVITPNENKLLLNPLLLALRAGGAKRVAFWGKGTIARTGVANPSEWFRYRLAGAVDWWFPYTEASAENLRSHGVRCGITPIDNSMDTSELRRELESISDDVLLHARTSIGLPLGPVGLFCGNLSANKHLDFLFAAAEIIHQSMPNFSLLVLGNGPLRDQVELVATRRRFIRYLGPRIGREKALLLKMADLFLLPGSVGLAVLDSFAAGLPLLTTELSTHGPEIDYLSHGHNGMIAAHDPNAYAALALKVLQDPELHARLRTGATQTGYRYSIENMVQNFRRGILSCLATRSAQSRPSRAKASSAPGANEFKDLPGGPS